MVYVPNKPDTDTHLHVDNRICLTQSRPYISMYLHTCLYTAMHAYIHTYACTLMNVFVYVCMCMYKCMTAGLCIQLIKLNWWSFRFMERPCLKNKVEMSKDNASTSGTHMHAHICAHTHNKNNRKTSWCMEMIWPKFMGNKSKSREV